MYIKSGQRQSNECDVFFFLEMSVAVVPTRFSIAMPIYFTPEPVMGVQSFND